MKAIKKDNKTSHTADASNSFSLMNIEREIKVRDAIKYCIENFDSQTATNRIVEFWKDELKLQEQQFNISRVSNLLCSCEMPAKIHGKNLCWRCKRPLS